MISVLTTPAELAAYDTWITSHPEGSLWQSLEWKQFQESLGREVRIYAQKEGAQILASALVVIDRTSLGLATWDMPRGPLQDLGLRTKDLGLLLEKIVSDAKQDSCLCLYFSPAKLITNNQKPITSSRHEQPVATRILDLTQSEEDILKQMKPKGRYNITVAKKNGVTIEDSKDIDAFYALAKSTGERDQFGILPKRHYEAFLNNLPGSFLLLARSPSDPNPITAQPEIRNQKSETSHAQSSKLPTAPLRTGSAQSSPIAAFLGVAWNGRAYYYYGASDHAFRALMAPYALQWEAMTRCKAAGCVSYDLLGISPPEAPATHPWAGVGVFKEKFGGNVVLYPPEQQIVLRPVMQAMLRMKRRMVG